MAEGFLRHLAGDRFEAFSAGLRRTQVNPLAIKAMAEIGIDISGQRSKSIDEFRDKSFDYVIAVCANASRACPTFSSTHENIHWNLDDPAQIKGSQEERIAFFRLVRNQIKDKIVNLLRS